MPIYEYFCGKCQSTYEVIRPISKMNEPTSCPECGSTGERQLSAFAFKDGHYGRFIKSESPVANPPKPAKKPET
jgi:putative FmdB family regulatory protein